MYETTRADLAPTDLSCPVCGSVKTLQKRVNEDHDEIWICTDCPAVLFTYWNDAQIDRLYTVMQATPDNGQSMPKRDRDLP